MSTALSMTFHGINRILKRGFEIDVVATLQQVGIELNQALDAATPMLNKKMLKFRYGGKLYSGTEGRIKTMITINNRVYVVGLNDDRTPTIITTWHKEV